MAVLTTTPVTIEGFGYGLPAHGRVINDLNLRSAPPS